MLDAPSVSVHRERKGRKFDDDLRPSVRSLGLFEPAQGLRVPERPVCWLRAERPPTPGASARRSWFKGSAPTWCWDAPAERNSGSSMTALVGTACRSDRRSPPPLRTQSCVRREHFEEGFPSCPNLNSRRPRGGPRPMPSPRGAGPRRGEPGAPARCGAPGRRPRPRQSGDTRPAPAPRPGAPPGDRRRRHQWRRGRSARRVAGGQRRGPSPRTAGRGTGPSAPGRAGAVAGLASGRSVGRYFMCVHVQPAGHPDRHARGPLARRALCRPAADETTQIDGNIYWGRVQNVLPGMEAAFIDIGIPKNAVLYRGDVRYDRDDVEAGSANDQPRIEEVLRPGQTILCQVTKNPIGAKGARLTQEVSLPGRFAVLVPELGDLRDLQAPRRQRAPAAPPHHRRRAAGGPRAHRPHGGGGGDRRGARPRRRKPPRAVEGDRGRGGALGPASAALPGAGPRGPPAPRGAQRRVPRASSSTSQALYDQVRRYVASVSPDLAERVEFYDTDRRAAAHLRALPRARTAP